MTNFETYMADGANYQERCVLIYLQARMQDHCYNLRERKDFSSLKVARWENCREQGYQITQHIAGKGKQLTVIFFEHRNSDEICAIKVQHNSINSLSIADLSRENVEHTYNTKWDADMTCGWMDIPKMGEWIEEQFKNHLEALS